jgi:multidrug efflux pump subunit AcrB
VNSKEDVEMIPVVSDNERKVFLRDVATFETTRTPAEYDRLNQQRFITITANTHAIDLGSALNVLDRSIKELGELPAGIQILKKGQADLLSQTLKELQLGLLIAIGVIFLMLSASFQSFKIATVTIAIIPAVVAGSIFLLLIIGHSLNIQSYMGMIMAVGVAVANSILYVTNAEDLRKSGDPKAYFHASSNRIRPILMTSFAMMAGITPLALGLGEGGDQIAPLGVAVIGGLFFSMLSTLLFLPLIYNQVVGKHPYSSESLNPLDKDSKTYLQ